MKKYTPKYSAEVASNWLKSKHSTIFFHNKRKVYTGRGEYHTKVDWAIYGADSIWHNLDTVVFANLLGGNYDPREHNLADVLRGLGYRVHDEGGAMVVVFDDIPGGK